MFSYFILGILGIIVIVNTFFTAWIITSTGLGTGFSSIRLWSRQVEASGSIIALKSMVATQIQNENDISLFSGGNLTVVANHGTRRSSMIQMDKQSRVKVAAERFEVSDTRGRNILASTLGTTVISSPNLQIQSEGGQSFRAGVETQAITAGPSNPLRISSPVGNLDMMGPQSVNLASFAGPITLEAYDIISLRSKGRGNIELNGGSIRMPGIANRTSYPSSSRQRTSSRPPIKKVKTYQLCSCKDGRLFMVSPSSSCVADYHICASS